MSTAQVLFNWIRVNDCSRLVFSFDGYTLKPRYTDMSCVCMMDVLHELHHLVRHVPKGGGGRGVMCPPQILADQKAPLAGGGAPHYCVPPQIFRLWHMPAI